MNWTKEEEIYYIMYEKLDDIIFEWTMKNCGDGNLDTNNPILPNNLNDSGLWFCRGCGSWVPWEYYGGCELLPHWFKEIK